MLNVVQVKFHFKLLHVFVCELESDKKWKVGKKVEEDECEQVTE